MRNSTIHSNLKCVKTFLLLILFSCFSFNGSTQTGTVSSPYTALGMARNVPSAGIYYFNLTGTTFSSYVDANGWVQVAIDYGSGEGSLPQVTNLTNGSRGILNATVLSKLTTATQARLSSSTGNINVVTTNATILSRITQNYILSRGAVDNTINSGWTGTNLNNTQFSGCCGCTQSNTALNNVIFHACGNASGFHWVQISNKHTENNVNNEIPSNHYFQLWVRAETVAVVSAPTISTQPSSTAQSTCLHSSVSSLSVSVSNSSSETYQWYSNTSASNSGGTLITGATSASYIPPTSVSGVRYYYVVATNSAGSITSSVSGSVTVHSPSPSTTPQSGDLVWNGMTNSNWNNISNWYAYNGSGYVLAATLPSATTNIIVPQTNGTCVIANPTVNIAAISINSIIIESGGSLSLNANTLNVAENFVNNGTFNAGTGTINFNGNIAQSISGTVNFYNMTVNHTGNGVTLNSPIIVAENLTMNQGNIITSNANILEVGNSVSTLGSVNWTSGTVVGPMKRWFAATTNTTQESGIFPIGNSTYNRYAKINFTQAPSTGGYIIAEYVDGPAIADGIPMYNGLPALINGQMIQNVSNEGYYEITPYNSSNTAYGALNSSQYDLVLRGNQLTEVTEIEAIRIVKSTNHTAWNDNPSNDGDHVAPTGFTSDFIIGATGMQGFSWFNFGSSNENALPVELISFSATCTSNGTVDVKWSTASESNSDYFLIEKSYDGTTWNTINKTQSAGNSNSFLQYMYSDNDPSREITYYRLSQFDFDGASETYSIISIDCQENVQTSSLLLYPNPNQGKFNVQFINNIDLTKAVIQVHDMAGVVVYSQIVHLENGKNLFPIENSQLQNGIYMVCIQGETESFYSKMCVEK